MALDVHVVSHTHWDREWYLTREQYRLRLVDLIDGVLERMEREPEFRHFHLDGQTIVLEDYLELRPENEARLRQRIAEGRLLVGPWYVMPDMHLVSGEALVRNLALGHRIAESFGAVMKAGYMPDPFGHVAQMPQILQGFGLDSAILWRGFGGERAEYRWQGLDGSEALLLHLPREGYCNALWLPLLPAPERAAAAAAAVAREAERSGCGTLLLMAGVDHVEPHPALLELVAEIGRQPGVTARLSTLPAYVAAVRAALAARGGAPELVRGELRGGEQYAPLLPGVLSARGYLKSANACVQRLLERGAEPAAAFAARLGAAHPTGALGYAWRTLLQNHPHDSICGCSVDAVHDENLTRFARVEQAAKSLQERALETIANALPAPPADRFRFLALNADIHGWRGVLEATLDVPCAVLEPGRHADVDALERPLLLLPREAPLASIRDAAGRPLPLQVLAESEGRVHFMSRHAPPVAVAVRRIRVALEADVAAGSLAAFDACFGPGALRPRPSGPGAAAGERSLENEHLRLEVAADGTLDVRHKASGRSFRRALELRDGGDVGDEYNHQPPPADLQVGSADAQAVQVRVEQPGPLLAELRVTLSLPLPARASADRRGRTAERRPLPVELLVSLRAGARRVEVSGWFDNAAEDHRLRLLFPTAARRVTAVRADTAFGVVARPARRERPARVELEAPVDAAPLHSFVDAGDASSGVSVFADGVYEYELVDETEPRIALTLLRSVGWLSRDDLASRRGHAGPGLATPGAQCLGRQRFRVAFAPRAAPPSPAELFREAQAFLLPPPAFGPAGRDGRLAARHCFVEIESQPPGAAVLSALKRADDREALIVRLFNPGAAAILVSVGGERAPLQAVYRTDLAERREQALPLDRGRASFALGPGRIETLELQLEG